MSDPQMIGKLVRWECDGQWLTARVTGRGTGIGEYFVGDVVDPGNYTGLSMFAPKQSLTVGQHLPNLVPDLITVVDEPESVGGVS